MSYKKSLYQYAVLYHKKTDTEKFSVESSLIIEPKYCLAASEKEVLFKVTREIPEDYIGNPDDVEIIIRNF